ncbi:MAG: PilZ domain-containing protein, partial [Clostridiales bacterium]
RIIAVKNVPINYCVKCSENFYADDMVKIVKYAIKNMSEKRQIILYEDALFEYRKNIKPDSILPDLLKIQKEADPEKAKEQKKENEEKQNYIFDVLFYGKYYHDCIKTLDEKMSHENLQINSVILIYHYVSTKPLKCIIKDKKDNCIISKFLNEMSILNFAESDPIVARFSVNQIGYNIGATVNKVDKKNNKIEFSINRVDYFRERRKSDRFPVSIYADMCKLYSSKKHSGIVKDLSRQGLFICIKDEFAIGSGVEIYLQTKHKIIAIIGSIVRKQDDGTSISGYGVEIVKISNTDLEYLKQYIINL